MIRTRHRGLTGMIVASLVIAACGAAPGGGTAGPGTGATAGPNPAATADLQGPVAGSALVFGAAPKRDAEVTYQPDVVFLDNGPGAVRSVTSDGLTWAIDRHAPGVDAVKPGVVLYATSLAVGRVVQVVEQGADELAVTLAPVGLGEVIKDGRIKVSQEIDLAGWGLRSMPDTPGLRGELAPLEPTPTQAATAPRMPESWRPPRAYFAPLPNGPATNPALSVLPTMPPPYNEGETDWSVGDWSGKVTRTGGDISFNVLQDGDLKWAGKVTFHFSRPHLDADIGIIDGEVGDGAIELRGLRQIAIGLQAGSVNGLGDNTSEKLELPVSLDTPVIVGGLAMNLNVTFKFLVQTAFTAKNSTLEAFGAWDTEGPLSYSRTSGTVDVHWPTITPNPNILDSLKSISVGTNGAVFAVSIKVMLGLGVPAFNAGPYAQVATSVALASGSSIGFAGAAMMCRQATVTIQGSFGAGLTISDTVAAGLQAYSSVLGVPLKFETESQKPLLSEPLYSNSFWMPDTEYCKLGT